MTRVPLLPVQLNALACFEAAGRHASFTHAARELGITQAAVSKQIKALESRLNARLFDRGNRAVALTEAGKKLYEGVSAGMRTIGETLEALSSIRHPPELVVTTTVAMASLWLMPRIASFRAQHPGIAIRLIATDTLLDFLEDRVDVAIRYGNGDWPHLNSKFLLGVRFFPCCSPDYLARHPMRTAEDLRHARLLNLEGPAARYSEWEWWFASNGIAVSKLDPELSFNNYPLLVQAALSGQGVLLAWGNVIDNLIDDGSLVRIIDGDTPANQSYYVVTTQRRTVREEARTFCEWLLADTRQLR
ncbi:transcriptional regulator, LysR family [Bosea lathyri]|uniref:Transcriptional regulator, LysR family n=1 Tax=Bosea lathyri TaxID=1036778 RepID=A0A1H6CAV3_9HYPH|nr:transcriptional regulator, LysR family [Bosea lathyri]